MLTQPGIQAVLPWFEGQLPLQPIDNDPEPNPIIEDYYSL